MFFNTFRRIPEEEIQAIQWALEKIFSCDMASLPPAMLDHVFWPAFARVMPIAKDYLQCAKAARHKIGRGLAICQKFIRSSCGNRFGSKPDSMDLCKRYLWGNFSLMSKDPPKAVKYASGVARSISMPRPFRTYTNCIAKATKIVRDCAAKTFDKACSAATVRAVKTVRATMDVPEYFLRKYPDFYLLHSFRDPRGAVLSRSKIKWSRGIFGSQNEIQREAHVYCANVLQDHIKRLRLERKYQQRITQILYDDFVNTPLDSTASVYQFLGAPIPDNVILSFGKFHISRNISASKATQWRAEFNDSQIATIEDKCQPLMKQMHINMGSSNSEPNNS